MNEKVTQRIKLWGIVQGVGFRPFVAKIADRLGMPNEMLRVAIRAAYGDEAVASYRFQKEDSLMEKQGKTKYSGGLRGLGWTANPSPP